MEPDDQRTTLHLAAQENNEEGVVQLLAQNSRAIDAVDHSGQTALHYAARAGHVKIVKLLLAQAEVADKQGRTALHFGLFDDEVVAQLLAHKPGLAEMKDSLGMTVLHYAAMAGRESVVVRLLDVKPSLIEETNGNQDTALHLAAANGHGGVVAQLLARAPPNTLVDREIINPLLDRINLLCETALQLTAANGHACVMAQLLAHHPTSIEARNNMNQTLLHVAAAGGHVKVVYELLALSPDLIITVDANNRTALHLAAQKGHVEVVSELLEAYPPLADVEDLCHRSALFTAAEYNQAPAVELLLPVTPKALERRDYRGHVLLHLAVKRCPSMIEKVWRMNPEAVHVFTKGRLTPFMAAVRSNNWSAIELFQPKLALDDIFEAFANHCDHDDWRQAHARLRLLVEGQCSVVLEPFLLRDLVHTIYKYLGARDTCPHD